MTALTEITNYAGHTFRIGARVRHWSGWEGTIIGIREQRVVDLLLVQPDDCSQLIGYDREYALNAEVAARVGRATHCGPRDHGLSMGNYKPL